MEAVGIGRRGAHVGPGIALHEEYPEYQLVGHSSNAIVKDLGAQRNR